MTTSKTYIPDFSGSFAKLNRAVLYCNELNRGMNEYFSNKDNRCTVRSDFEESSGDHVFSVAAIPDMRPMQIELSVVIGNICHNLRSALDHAAFQLALHHTNDNITNERGIQFPIVSDATKFQKSASTLLKELKADHQSIIEKLQPYHSLSDTKNIGRKHPLELLQELSNTDKHRLLNTTLTVPAGSFDFTIPGMVAEVFIPMEYAAGSALYVGQQLASLNSPGDPPIPHHIDFVGHLTPVLTLVGEKDPVVVSLLRISNFVKYALEQMRADWV
jgi:hypothetical protein